MKKRKNLSSLHSKNKLNKYEKKAYHFLYTASFLTICTGSIHLIHNNPVDVCNFIAIGTGLYGIGNSILPQNNTIRKLKIYQVTSLLGSIGSGTTLILSTNTIPIIINGFLTVVFLLFSYDYYKQKKNLTKSYYLKK